MGRRRQEAELPVFQMQDKTAFWVKAAMTGEVEDITMGGVKKAAAQSVQTAGFIDNQIERATGAGSGKNGPLFRLITESAAQFRGSSHED